MTHSEVLSIEEEVAKAWIETLGLRTYEENLAFDEAGGDSLKILRVLFRLEQALSRTIPLNIIHGGMTPRDLVKAIAGLRPCQDGDSEDRPLVWLLADDVQDGGFLATLRESLTDWFRFETIGVPQLPPAANWVDAVVDSIASRQPTGAIHVVGYGASSLTALAVARRFERARSRAGLSALIAPSAGSSPSDEAFMQSEDLRVRKSERTIPVLGPVERDGILHAHAAALGLTLPQAAVEFDPDAMKSLTAQLIAAFVACESAAGSASA